MYSRRHCLQLLTSGAALACMRAFGAQKLDLSTLPAHPKILIVYFTWAGSTQTVAREIARLTGGDLARVEPVKPYPSDYKETGEVAKAELAAQARPAIRPGIPDVRGYDIVCIGHPIWSGHMPMPVYTYLESVDLSGKVVLHFCTHGGSGLAGTHEELKRLAPKAVLPEGLAVYGWHGVRNIEKVAQWLSALGLIEKDTPRAR